MPSESIDADKPASPKKTLRRKLGDTKKVSSLQIRLAGSLLAKNSKK